MLSDSGQQHSRPISVDHAGGQVVVHGVYGLVLANAVRANHLALTWSNARPAGVVCQLTNLASGETCAWPVDRVLLREGGTRGALKVDLAGDITFLEVTGTDCLAWISINRRWLTRYTAVIDQVVAGTHQ